MSTPAIILAKYTSVKRGYFIIPRYAVLPRVPLQWYIGTVIVVASIALLRNLDESNDEKFVGATYLNYCFYVS